MIEIFNGPGFLSARSTLGSDLSYIFALLFTMMFLMSGYLARKKKGIAHHRMILASMFAMLAYFAFYYEVRKLGTASMADQVRFHGPQWVYQNVFRPVMYAHFTAVLLSIIMAVYMIVNGFKTAITGHSAMMLRKGEMRASKTLWGIGLVWLAMLSYWVFSTHRFGLGHQVMFLSLGYFIPALAALAINIKLPDSEQRHRMLGKISLALFGLLLVTSTLIYGLLYVVEY